MVILENKIAKMMGLWHPRNLQASKIFYMYTVTDYQNIIIKSLQVCFCYGLFLRPDRHSQMLLRCPLNASGWLVQSATLLKSHMIGRFIIQLMNLAMFCNICLVQWGLLVAIFTLKIAEICCNPPPHHPNKSPCGIDKMAGIQLAVSR